jgi:rhodanese-related sulfurtransferase
MVRSINRDELRKKLRESPGRVVLVDVRERADYEREHIKGAISIPISELSMRIGNDYGKDAEIIVYCGSFECTASTKASEMLLNIGYENVLEYEGGLKDWKTAGFMTEGPERLAA